MYGNNKQGNDLSRDELRTYKYDELDRLVGTEIKDNLTYRKKNICYKYDKEGNRIKETETESNIVSDANAGTYGNNASVNTSVVSTEEYTTSTVYTYNDLDQLVKAVETSGSHSYTTTYGYDKNGNQTKVTDEKNNTITENGIKTCYFYEGDTLLYTTDDSGNKTSQNIIGLESNTMASIQYDA